MNSIEGCTARHIPYIVRLYAPVDRWEVVIYSLLAALVIAGRFLLANGTYVTDDSYQYLSVATHWVSGQGLQTALIHFDTEQSWQRVPAPLTTFPPMYAMTIALLSLLGIDGAMAGVCISMLAGVLLVPMLYWGARLINCSGLATRMMMLALIANSWFSFYSMYILSEAIFALVSTTSLLILIHVVRPRVRQGGALGWLLVANLLIGLAYWIRYAGLFLFCAVGLACVVYLWHRRTALAWQAVACLSLSGGLVTLGLIRNAMLVGTWRGGNNKIVTHSVVDALQQYVLQFHHLLMGGVAQPRLWVVDILFLLGLMVCLGLGVGRIRSGASAATTQAGGFVGVGLLALYAIVYSGATIYLAIFSVVDIYPRLFYPLLPTLLLLGGSALSAVNPPRRLSWRESVLAGMVLLYVVNNIFHALAPSARAPHLLVAQQLTAGAGEAANLRAWIDAHISPETTIVANEGQAAGYLLRRNTVSLVSSRYSVRLWDEEAIRNTLRAYQSPFLLLFKETLPSVVAQSSFLSGLMAGQVPPWLEVAAKNPEVTIFRYRENQIPRLATR